MVYFFKGLFLGLVRNIKQKVLSTPQGTECCQAPQEMYMTGENVLLAPWGAHRPGVEWVGADNSQSTS